ncbi:ESX secretion-associated protein EspG [Nocardia sp. NPDC003963]
MPGLTNDELLALTEQLGIRALPSVLEIRPGQTTVADVQSARQRALKSLRGSGVIDRYDQVDDELTTAIHVLAHPDRELVARIYTRSGTRRLILARRGARHAVARRDSDEFAVNGFHLGDDLTTLARPLLDALGPARPATVATLTAPSAELAGAFDSAGETADFVRTLRRSGFSDEDASTLGTALADCSAHAEVVAYARDDGVAVRSRGAVAIYDTARGRLVAGATTSMDQQVWSTLMPGSEHRIEQAVSNLINTLPGYWWGR